MSPVPAAPSRPASNVAAPTDPAATDPAAVPAAGRAIVVMGASGAGKSTFGVALAAALGCPFLEGDDFHPPENIARMRSGIALTDADRAGWLDAIGLRLGAIAATGAGVVASCSALKRAYRDRLRRHCPGLVFICLDLDRATARRRVSRRTDHFMPAVLVDSQFATLEPPAADEQAIRLDARRPIGELVDTALRALAARMENS